MLMRAPPSQRRRPGLTPRFRIDTAGVSAVEFALILPLMLTLWAGMSEMAHAIDNWRKVTQLARTVADLTSQGDQTNPQTPFTTADMNDLLASATAVLRPFPSTSAKIVVSALAIDTAASTTNPRVCSSVANGNGTARSTGVASDLTIPAGYLTNGNRYVLAEVTTAYVPMIGTSLVKLVKGINGNIMLKMSQTWPTRGGQVYNSITSTTEVVMPGGSACP